MALRPCGNITRQPCTDTILCYCNMMLSCPYVIMLSYQHVNVSPPCHGGASMRSCHIAATPHYRLKTAPKIRHFRHTGNIRQARWHQTASDVVTRHAAVCFTEVYTDVILQGQNPRTVGHIFRRTAARRSRRAAIRRRWILCSNEQSKLCLCPTESILPDKDRLALPHGRGISLRSRKI